MHKGIIVTVTFIHIRELPDMNEKKGKQSIKFGNPPYILGAAAVAGPKEIDGPMARYFDRVSEDATFGKDSWEGRRE